MNKMLNISTMLTKLNVDYKLVGKYSKFNGFSSFFDQTVKSCTFIKEINPYTIEVLSKSVARIFIVNELPLIEDVSKTFIIVKDPRRVFFTLLRSLYKQVPIKETYIHPTSIVSPKAKIGQNVYIGEYCIIGECEIGNSTNIGSYSKIHDGVLIGNCVDIHDHCNIGGIGLGHVWEDDKYVNQTHIGSVLIEDYVELLSYTNVGKATLGTTRIGKGTKIDIRCSVGHNANLGEHNLIMANSIISGSVNLGSKNIVGAGTIFRENIKVGSENFFGMHSSVLKNTNDKEIWYGSPAKFQGKRTKMMELIFGIRNNF